MAHRRYDRDFEMSSAMVTASVIEKADGTIWLHFENEHGEYAITLEPRESAELRATLGAAEGSIKLAKMEAKRV